MENLQPTVVCKMMQLEKLLSGTNVHTILRAPMDYMRNLYIFEHIHHMETPNLFRLLDILQRIDSQKHISNKLTKGLCKQYYVFVVRIYVANKYCMLYMVVYICAHRLHMDVHMYLHTYITL